MSVYITDMAAFLPNEPVNNQQMEEMLSQILRIREAVGPTP